MSYEIKSIKNVELASVCNMSCVYCLSPQIKDHRKAGLMSFKTFKKVTDKIVHFYNQGTQGEIWLHGTGESLLNTELIPMIKHLTSRVPLPVYISTNGILVDDEMVANLKRSGISRVDVSCHDLEIAEVAHAKLKEAGITTVINYGPRDSKFNWADQLDFENASENKPPCPWINNSECFIMHDGSIVNCCFDVFGKNIIGNIEDDITKIEVKEFELCHNCNHTTN